MKNYIHIKSTIPSQISINGENLIQSQVDIVSTRDFYIAFFPNTVEKYLPSATSFEGDIRPSSITKIPYKNNHYDIIFNPAIVPDNSKIATLFSKKYNNTIFSISNSNNNSFVNITNNSFTHNSTTFPIKNVISKTSDGYMILVGKITNSKEYLLIFNTKKNNILIEDVFNKIEIGTNQIKALKDNNTITGYGAVTLFNLSNKSINQYSVFLNKIPRKINTPGLVPMAFLESLKYGDFNTAKSYLEYQNVTKEHFKNYFGDIKEIYFNPYSKDSNYTILSDKFKSFTFILNNNKIVDIEENNLNLV